MCKCVFYISNCALESGISVWKTDENRADDDSDNTNNFGYGTVALLNKRKL